MINIMIIIKLKRKYNQVASVESLITKLMENTFVDFLDTLIAVIAKIGGRVRILGNQNRRCAGNATTIHIHINQKDFKKDSVIAKAIMTLGDVECVGG